MTLLKVGITGQSGFIGTHIYNTLGLYSDNFTRIPFEDNYFSDEIKLEKFVQSCDIIVHLAAMNRHIDSEVIYQTNIRLVKQLIDACETTHSTPHILFSSSIQEERDNLFGKSKREGRELLEHWAKRNNARFTGLVIPNVFGPFGNPYYNSVVATFCHQLTHNEQPKIEVDGEIKLIYVGELVAEIIKKIKNKTPIETEIQISINPSNQSNLHAVETCYVPHTYQIKVSALLQKLKKFKQIYFQQGIIPSLDETFEKNLFNTFLCYIDHATFFPFNLQLNTDERGSFVEMIRLNSGGQVSFSITNPDVTRGNHFHTHKAERFVVIKGRARIEFRKIGSDKIFSYELDSTQPAFVDMPIWHTHNIANIGQDELLTIFWINEHFDKNNQDTFYEKV